MRLRVALVEGQVVKIVGLGHTCTGIVVRLIDRGVSADLISDDGYWVVNCNGHYRDVQRRHLKAV